MLTGIGGGGAVRGGAADAASAVLTRAVRPRPRDALTLALVRPPAGQRAVISPASPAGRAMAPQAAKQLVVELLASEAATEPRRLKERLGVVAAALRYLEVGTASPGSAGSRTDTRNVRTLLSPLVRNAWPRAASATVRRAGPRGPAAIRRPPSELDHRGNSKTCFDKVFWTEHARAFARGWGMARGSAAMGSSVRALAPLGGERSGVSVELPASGSLARVRLTAASSSSPMARSASTQRRGGSARGKGDRRGRAAPSARGGGRERTVLE